MTGAQLQAIRRQLCGTDTHSFGRALGLGSTQKSIEATMRRLETARKVKRTYAILAAIYIEQPKWLFRAIDHQS